MFKKTISVIIATVLVLTTAFAALPASVSAAAAGTGYYKVTTSGSVLNIRSSASKDSTKVGAIPNGALVNVSQVSGSWGKTTYNGVTGWISLDYATKSASPGSPGNANVTAFASIYTKLNELRAKFPNDKYWNWMGKSKKDVDSWTNTPCPSSGSAHKDTSHCNGQCDGFARKLGLDLFGLSTYSWQSTSYNINTICVGDLIRYNGKHTIMVVGFTNDTNTLIIADCNWNCNCNIRWDASFSTSKYLRTVNWVLHYPGNNLNRANYLANKPADVLAGKTTTTVKPTTTTAKPTTTTTKPTTTTTTRPTTTVRPSVYMPYYEYTLCVGGKLKLEATAKPAGSAITWKSENTNLATVDASGTVTAKAEGDVVITASTDRASETCTVHITGNVTTTRLAGEGRIETAAKIAESGWTAGKTENVILANGFSFADALAGVPLSKALDAPIFLTENKNGKLESIVTEQISKLGAKNVYILGGELVVGKGIESELAKKYSVVRIAGTTRFDTSIAIAEKLEALCGKSNSVYIANGFGFADVLSVSTAAALQKSPIIYTESDGSLNSTISSFIKSKGFSNAYAIGGAYVVSDASVSLVKNLGVSSVERLSGTTRFDTCLAVLKKFQSLYTGNGISLATGYAFPDALAGGAYAAKLGIPLVLVDTDISSGIESWVSAKNPDRIFVFGGPYVVSDRQMYQYTA